MAFPATYNIQYYKGDTYQFVIRPKTSAGVDFSITPEAYNAYFRIDTVRGRESGTGFANGTASISTNSVICTITPEVGKTFNSQTVYYYDVSIENKTNPNIVYTLLTGTISITSDIVGIS